MNNYEKKFSLDIIEAVQKLKSAFDSQCTKENPYFEELSEECETKEGAIDMLAQSDDFIEEYLKDETVDLIKKILSKHVWFKYFAGYIPPALEDYQPTLERVENERKEINSFLHSIGEECNY